MQSRNGHNRSRDEPAAVRTQRTESIRLRDQERRHREGHWGKSLGG